MNRSALKFDKLPKWAQREIERLQRDLEHAKARLATGPEDSRVFADPYNDTPRPLGHDTTIDFRFSDSWHDRLTVRIEGNGVRLMGGSRLVITPEASNVVHIETRER